MSSIGGFRKGEIDGKSFLIYTLLPETGELVICHSFKFLPEPFYLCPSSRMVDKYLKKEELVYSRYDVFPFKTFPHYPGIRVVDEKTKYVPDSKSYDDICKLPIHPLFWCNNKESNDEEFNCGACFSSKLGTDYHFCETCSKMFHKECVKYPFEIKHPLYPLETLKLVFPFLESFFYCVCCDQLFGKAMYHSPTYKLIMHPVCAMKPIPFVIDHPKRHPHPLTFFPKQTFLPCDVCSMTKVHVPVYVCLQCAFVVHRDCVYFPYVIRISRHHHRISFSYSLPSRKLSCGVCRQKVDNNYSAYICTKCDDCIVHTRCALRKDVWNGEELEEVPEEPDMDVEPFERIADGTILHFSHGHRLKLEINKVYHKGKCCQACALLVNEGNHYSCVDKCDFFLHEACTNAPRMKYHALHPHPLTLNVVTNGYDDQGHFTCDACRRISCGFVYENVIGDWCFRLDLRCALVSEPFEYQGHKHPLFMSLTPEEEGLAICQICQEEGDEENFCRKLNCLECKYIICFKCATLPYKARYKHDQHLLTFQKETEANDELGWCEICERTIVYSRKGGFYSCDDCCTTLHVHCLLGKDMYMKPGQTMIISQEEVHILHNNTNSRPFCHAHDEDRCPDKIVFIKNNMTFCSYSCSMNRLA